MIRRLIAAIIVFAAAWAGPSPVAQAQAGSATVLPLWGPYCTGSTGADRTVHWKTAEPTWGILQYATEEHLRRTGSYTGLVGAAGLRQLHHVRLRDLLPNTTYHYRVWIISSETSQDGLVAGLAGDAEGWLARHGTPTPDYRFRTPGELPLTFVVYGDSQEQTPWFTQLERHKLVADYIAQEEGLSFVIHLGDLTYDPEDMAGWDLFFEAAREMLGRHTLFVVQGNHENNSRTFAELFGAPAYYSFVVGDARFTVLDTNSWADLAAQRQWLAEQLRPPSQWDFVFYHHPAYSSDVRNYGGWERSTKEWGSTFADVDVTAIFSGHVHAYERYLAQGIQHLVVGTGGGALSNLSPEAPEGLQNRLAKTLGYAKVTVDAEAVTIAMVQVARVSEDNRRVETLYPFGSVYETVVLAPASGDRHLALPAGGFQVSPVALDLTMDGDGSQRFSVRIVSSHDALVRIGTENLPYRVNPATIQVSSSEQGQRYDIELLGDKGVPEGTYEGKLTFLRDAGDNVALGVKVKAVVVQSGTLPGWRASLAENRLLLGLVALIVSLNVAGVVIYRKYRARLAHSEDVP